MSIMSSDDYEFEKLNNELLAKRKLIAKENTSTITEINDIDAAVKHAMKMAELSKQHPKTIEPVRVDITPKVNTLFPKRFRDKTFESYIGNENLKENIKKSIAKGQSIMMIGQTGSGKTHLAVSASRQMMINVFERENLLPSFKITTIIEMQSAILDKSKTIDDYKKTDVLIIDDLGAEKEGEWSTAKIFELINHRYMQMLPTVITTNHTGVELSNKIGQRSVSRIIEMCDIYQVEGKDYRIKPSKPS